MGCGSSSTGKGNDSSGGAASRGGAGNAAGNAVAPAAVDDRLVDLNSSFSIAGTPADVQAAFARAPFLAKAFNAKGQKLAMCPDDIAETFLLFDTFVFQQQNTVRDTGRLQSFTFSIQRPDSWQKREVTGEQMGSVVNQLADASPEIKAKLKEDTPEQRQKQIDSYMQVRMGDLSDSGVVRMQITTELLHPAATVHQYKDFKMETLKAVKENMRVESMPTFNSAQEYQLGKFPALIIRNVSSDSEGNYYIFCIPTASQGIYIHASWESIKNTDGGVLGKHIIESVLDSWEMKE